MSGRDKFKKFRTIINIFVFLLKILPIRLRKILFTSIRNLNGIKGIAARYIILKSINSNVGDNVSIHPGCYLFGIDNLIIGNNVSIHPMCYIDATGGIEIGSDVSIAHSTTILSTSHSFDIADESIKYQKIISKKTKIDNNVWIGAKVTILYGNSIGTGTVIGANSLINKDVPDNSVAFNEKSLFIRKRN